MGIIDDDFSRRIYSLPSAFSRRVLKTKEKGFSQITTTGYVNVLKLN